MSVAAGANAKAAVKPAASPHSKVTSNDPAGVETTGAV